MHNALVILPMSISQYGDGINIYTLNFATATDKA
jgi:hypothetical protein